MISQLTAWMIQGNDLRFINVGDRAEMWSVKDGCMHARLLSCPIDRDVEMINYVLTLRRER